VPDWGVDAGIQVIFDPAFDEGAWPGAVPQPGAAVGQAWVGLEGLVEALEVRLALAGPGRAEGRRAAALVPRLLRQEGFWSESARVDPLGTARLLLRWRDTLRMGGWRGQSASARLQALDELTAPHPGLPDRIQAILDRLSRHGSPFRQVVARSQPLERLGRDLLERLQAHHVPLAASQAAGDLESARGGAFTPSRDGSLQMLRPGGPLEAAEEVAAWLAVQPDLEQTLVLGPAPVLDSALHRAGLPTVGAAEARGQSCLLQLLPLVLACGWDPPDPDRVLELLTVGVGPIPRGVGASLARALGQWPAVGSQVWNDHLDSALQDREYADSVRARVQTLLHGEVARSGGFPAEVARRRADRLVSWLQGRLGTEETSRESWLAALQQVREFDALVAEAGLESLSEAQLQRLVAQATDSVSSPPAHSACAGLHPLGGPACVAGPARRIVWWNFCLSTVVQPARLPLTGEERRALLDLGVELPDPGRQARARAEQWRRPLQQATQALVLVCPLRADGGAPEFPHPLWDEIAARAGQQGRDLESRRPFGEAVAPRVPRQARPLAAPRRFWSVPPGSVPPRGQESPGSLSKLIGCPFSWAVHYVGEARAGGARRLPDEAALLGRLAHEILARVLPAAAAEPGSARQRAETLFDEIGPTLAAPLFLPGADAARARARRLAGTSAEVLALHLRRAGMQVTCVESTFQRQGLDGRVEGRVDLVVGPPSTILDLKSSTQGSFVKLLQQGTAYQLATYSYLLEGAPVGYFTLEDGALLVTRPGLFEKARVVEGPEPDQTWHGLEQAVRVRHRELAEGRLESPANPGPDGETGADQDGLVEGRLVLAPPCRWCEFTVLCGQALAEEEVPDGATD